jgi:hypothetical protein
LNVCVQKRSENRSRSNRSRNPGDSRKGKDLSGRPRRECESLADLIGEIVGGCVTQIRICKSTPERYSQLILGAAAGTSAEVLFDRNGFRQIKLIVEVGVEQGQYLFAIHSFSPSS